MNNGCLIFDDVMFRKKKIPNEAHHLFIIGGADTCKIFILMHLIQGLLCFYNKYSQLDSSKRKILFMAYTRKTTFNIDGITISSSISIPLNCQDFSF
jgi:hypothetical protein